MRLYIDFNAYRQEALLKQENIPIHVWKSFLRIWLVGEQRMFASVSVGDVEPHIPKEAGLGTWKSVEIPFNVFEKRFVPMEAII